MPITIMDAPKRGNDLTLMVPDLDDLAKALKDASPKQVVAITDPLDKQGTARNIASHARDMLAEEPHKLTVRTTVIKQGDGDTAKYVGAISLVRETPAAPDKPAPAAGKKG